METALSKPNLFDYATSELSQDAFLCWFIDCANPRYQDVDPNLREKAQEFVGLMVGNCTEKLNIEGIKVDRQFQNIDVLVQVECGSDNRYCIIIEDKTHTSNQSDQIQRYKNVVESCDEYAGHTIIPIYLKTGNMTSTQSII